MSYSTGMLSVPCLSHILFCITTVIYLHISCLFFFSLGTKNDAAEILQGLFVFPDSRAVQRGDIIMTLHMKEHFQHSLALVCVCSA